METRVHSHLSRPSRLPFFGVLFSLTELIRVVFVFIYKNSAPSIPLSHGAVVPLNVPNWIYLTAGSADHAVVSHL